MPLGRLKFISSNYSKAVVTFLHIKMVALLLFESCRYNTRPYSQKKYLLGKESHFSCNGTNFF